MPNDLRIEVRARSSVMARWREGLGLSQRGAARLAGVSYGLWNALEVLREPALGAGGVWKPGAMRIAESMGMSPEAIWTKGVLTVTNPKRSIDVDAQQFAVALEEWSAGRSDALPSSDAFDLRERGDAVGGVLKTLTVRQERVLRMRFWDDMTLDEVAAVLGVSTERVRQVEGKALRKLRHPSRCKLLKPFVCSPT